MIKNFVKNCAKPEGLMGSIVLGSMNSGHDKLCKWMMDCVKWEDGAHILDVGCGGGANIVRMSHKYPASLIDGVDYSETSVVKSQCVVKDSKLDNKCHICQGDVMSLPYSNNTYHVVTAIETIYFWQDPVKGCKEIRRVLKNGGKIVVTCEMNDPEKGKKWTKYNENMTVYTGDELKEILEKAGFKQVKVYKKDVWICLEGINE